MTYKERLKLIQREDKLVNSISKLVIKAGVAIMGIITLIKLKF